MTTILALVLLTLVAGTAEARIVKVVIDRTEPFAASSPFGTAGAYVRITGTAYGDLDPARPENAVIVNLDRAPRNAWGLVEYDVDFYLMRPADPALGSGKLLYEVTNRGRKLLLPFMNEATATAGAVNDPATAQDAGNGFVFRQGYTIVWSGWDPDAPRVNHGMAIRVPVATNAGAPIVRTIRDEFVFGTRVPESRPTAPLSYEAATLDQSRARLTVRARESESATEIEATGWAYGDSRNLKLLPEGTRFKPGFIYDFRYPARDPKVLGIGYAATRDLVSFLRYELRDGQGTANPAAHGGAGTGITAALAIGISQSGRYLRDHLELGFNRDEAGRHVFDGVLAHIAGVGKVFANVEFGQPNRTSTQHEDHHFPENHFPFAHARLTDPVSGKTAGLVRGDGFDPVVMEVNTSTEYWQKGASLLHTDPTGTRDIEVPATVRLYLVAGTQHGGRAGLSATPATCLHPRNPHNPTPTLRALLVALDRWATAGVEPPPSRVPRVAEGSLVLAEALRFPAIPGVQAPKASNHLVLFGDWTAPRHEDGKAYVARVPRVDVDGNEIAGIRLPPIAVPLATHTGWNFYRAPYPEGELCDRDGAYLLLPRTRADRVAQSDPRMSLEERYATREGYLRRVIQVVGELMRARLLLPEDGARYVDEAARLDPFKP
ncbi:MAG: hypothetical protein AUH30_20905 [Candidatus Rokubacteria bacterium 13_1_40CM_68_15]|nr:MAG: hypothetical protein AUH30_20905 [Candidatus Rokubacteria bacterium 13_1_40CM_68_15]